jgi:ABC-type multidrug transport system fused ATPase/permease subunit
MTLATSKYRRLWNYLKPYWGLELCALFTMMVLTALAIAMPIAIQYMIDTLIPGLMASARPIRIAPVALFSAFLIGVYLADVLVSWLRDYLAGRVGAGIIRDLRSDLYAHLQNQALRFFHEHQTGEIMSRVLSDVGRVQDLLTVTLLMLFTNSLMLVAVLAYLLHTNWLLTLIAVIPVPLTTVATNRFGRRLHGIAFDIQSKLADLSARIQQAFLSIKTIKAFGQEEREKKRIDGALGELTGLYIRNSVMNSLAVNVVQFINMVGPIVVLGWGIYLVVIGAMKLGQLIAFYILLTYLYGPIHGLAQTSIEIQSTMASVDRVFEYLDVSSAVAEAAEPVTITSPRGEIDFHGVSLSYPNSDFSLNRLSLHIRAGEKLALVGPSGSGKTSIANLAMRFFDPDEGTVTLDGIDLRTISLRSLRSAISLVDQDPLLFNVSINENIKYGRPHASQAEVVAAARAAGVHDFIISLPQGYDTQVGERGVTVSGGEKQRICLARAIVVNPRILILDEATSALDSASELIIQESLKHIWADKTAIIIAHRLSTVQHADRIAVLEGGRIVDQGTHSDLIERCPAYREAAIRQLAI